MSLNDKLYVFVPLASLLCNVFLFLSCVSAKKTRVIYAFMELLTVFMAWTGGSLFMRLQLYPDASFWYEVSIFGIFLVPYAVYNFIYYFCDSRGTFVKRIVLACWIAITGLNLMHVFIKDPRVLVENGEHTFTFTVSWIIVFPIVLAVLTFAMAWRVVYKSVKEDHISIDHLRPLLIGVAIMFVGTILDVFPFFVPLPNDTFVCGINALFLYYALYRKRLITLTHIASRSSTYLLSAVFTTLILVAAYPAIENLYAQYLSAFSEYKTIVIAVAFSLLTMVAYNLTRRLMNNLFTKRQDVQEATLKKFSLSVSKTLDLDQLLSNYKEFLQENTPDTLAYICVYDPANKRYSTAACTHDIQDISFSLPDTHPLIKWLEEHERSIFYSEFVRTITYKSMWDEEKKLLSDLRIDFILPHICDDTLAGVTLFCIGDPLHHFGYGEINFLESSAAILSIALKNASLYSAMQSEARQDALTGLLNRGYFSERIKKEFLLARHDIATLAMINLDDFRLYNELYGVWEGDALLQQVASNLRAIIGSRGIIARYSGKEFAVFLPFCDACIVQSLLENLRDLMNSQKRDEKFVTFTAGICSYPASACSIDELFTYASMAVYSGKRNGKNRIVVYSPGIVSTDTAPASKRALAENCASTIYALTAAIDAKDHYTFSHSQNVSDYASILAEAIPLDPEHVEIIRQAGLLHDIGKIGIPEAILSKTSQLTSCEYAIMKTHAEGATAMIRHLPSLDYVIPTATGHHERWDGKGYPRGLSGEMIPVGARCLCLADAFDAMTSKRSYKEARSVPDALAEIRKNLGTQFDPKLGTLFIELVESGKILVHPTTSIPESDLFQASRVQGVVPPTVLTDTPS